MQLDSASHNEGKITLPLRSTQSFASVSAKRKRNELLIFVCLLLASPKPVLRGHHILVVNVTESERDQQTRAANGLATERLVARHVDSTQLCKCAGRGRRDGGDGGDGGGGGGGHHHRCCLNTTDGPATRSQTSGDQLNDSNERDAIAQAPCLATTPTMKVSLVFPLMLLVATCLHRSVGRLHARALSLSISNQGVTKANQPFLAFEILSS